MIIQYPEIVHSPDSPEKLVRAVLQVDDIDYWGCSRVHLRELARASTDSRMTADLIKIHLGRAVAGMWHAWDIERHCVALAEPLGATQQGQEAAA